MSEKPPRYWVDYADQKLYERALKKAGGNPENIMDLAEYWTEQDFDTLEEAKAFADGQPMSCFVYERLNLRDETPLYYRNLGMEWINPDWDQSDIIYET